MTTNNENTIQVDKSALDTLLYAEHLVHRQLKEDLRRVLNNECYGSLCNETKAEILLELENNGKYDPLG